MNHYVLGTLPMIPYAGDPCQGYPRQLRAKGEILVRSKPPDAEAAKAAAAVQFEIDEFRRNRIIVQELA